MPSAAARRPFPGCRPSLRLTDAVFQPRIAEQAGGGPAQAATATTHDILLFAAVAYLDLLRAFQQQAIAQETLDHAEQLAKLTAAFARTGQGNQADADRAQTELALRKNLVAQAAAQTQGCFRPPGGTAQFAAGPRPGAGGADARADRLGFARG